MYERFYEFGLSDEVLNSISSMGFEEPSQIQKIAIPPVMKGKDIIGVAQTGTGKTAAFGIPIIEKSIRGKSKKPAAIVLVPTRELAMQVAEELNKIGRDKGFSSLPIYGGQSIERQIKGLKKGVDIVVGTPGRVIDHIRRKTMLLSSVTSPFVPVTTRSKSPSLSMSPPFNRETRDRAETTGDVLFTKTLSSFS